MLLSICLTILAATASSATEAAQAEGSENEQPQEFNAMRDMYFKIVVVDDETGRGAPLVELRTISTVRYYTDSNGIVAFFEPGMMNRDVWFSITSHGYEYPKDGFGFRGVRLKVKPGGSATVKIKRINVAERLYRVTGAGIYRDSVLVGASAPIKHPVLNAQVVGSDSVVNTVYRGKIYWFWGDTNRPAYVLGNFHVPGATSLLPADGGLDPEVGVDLEYFKQKNGFAKETCRMKGKGPTWLSGLVSLRDGNGRERLFGMFMKARKNLSASRRGLVRFNDEKESFEEIAEIPLGTPVYLHGHPFKHIDGGREYIYFGSPFPLCRALAKVDALTDLSSYEAYTCLKEGASVGEGEVDRNPDGSVRYSWKKNTRPLGQKGQTKLIKSGRLKPSECLIQFRDVETGEKVQAHGGSVYWNAFRRRWITITVQSFGKPSLLGEVWYAESDTPVGPWVYARKIVTHNKYSFYNPKQHPMLDKNGGREIFFEGTYVNTFSGNPDRTPRYNYNQVMYKLDLTDKRVVLPVPIYRLSEGGAANRFGTWHDLKSKERKRAIAFFALDRPGLESVPVFATQTSDGSSVLTVGAVPSAQKLVPVFHALPAKTKAPPNTTPLYEFVNEQTGQRSYSTTKEWSAPGYDRAAEAICLVWINPVGDL